MWTLLLYKQGDPPGVFLDRRQIDGGQIKVGRGAATCDWVIADTTGFLSREHCTIAAAGLDLFVVDTSTNGVALNVASQRIAPQQPVAVRVHDRLLLGDYVIEVATEAEGFGAQLQPPAAPGLEAAVAFAQPDAWFDQGSAVDPIWGSGASQAEVHDFLGNAMHDFLAPATPASGAAASFDPFAGGALGEAFSKPLLAQPVAVEADAFAIPADWAAPSGPAASAPDPFAGWEADPPAPALAGDPFGDPDPFGAPPVSPFGAGDPFAESFTQAAPPSAASAAKTVPPRPAALGNPAEATRTPLAAPAPDAAGWAAFCEGAGIDPADLRTSPDAMRRLGVLYRQVVLGLSDLIQDRASFKDEFRVERTQLSFGRNNPLKYLPPLDSAKLLLADPLPGFMGSEEAVRTALEDVKKHQLALLAGVQHALRAVFQRLSPSEVDRVMKKATAEKRGFALRRGVDPWSVYQAMFEALRQDATSNVNSVMSLAFREGYEAFLKSM